MGVESQRMLATRLIRRKRDGQSLTPEEWSALVAEYTAGRVPDYQMAALLMASYLNGMTDRELGALTEAMAASGERIEFEPGVIAVDKHSTGGVGDKVSLVLAPLVAACGIPVPMMSGRGLGHTTGTLDKLAAIPGFRTDLTLEEACEQVARIGCAMIGQTAEIAPADRRLYALRDSTATVESVPLIAASIMSKKLCEGIAGLVLDVKYGSGAFLPDREDALQLAQTMIRIGESRGCVTTAYLTAMDRPLGRACGNALETREAIAALRGEGPDDLIEVTLTLGSEMLVLGGVAGTTRAARIRLQEALDSGAALEKFGQIIAAQGGDPAVLDDASRIAAAPAVEEFRSEFEGFLAQVEPRAIGDAIVEMGGGRHTVDDTVDLRVGFEIIVRPGDRIARGELLALIHAADDDGVVLGRAALKRALAITEYHPRPGLPLVSHRITGAGVELLA